MSITRQEEINYKHNVFIDDDSHYYVDDTKIQERYMFSGDMRELATRIINFMRGKVSDKYLTQYYEEIAERRFIPAGNTLVVGKKPLQPNCSIIGQVNEQNYDQIEKRCLLLWENRIGVGFDLSTAQDPVAILHKLSSANDNTDVGTWRPKRGNMATLSVDHPRIMEFVCCKSASEAQACNLYNFNISVAVSDEFMQNDRKSTALLTKIAKHAHAYGDPGLVFIDRVQDEHERIVTAVPCGEQFMHNNETCNLGAINLDSFVHNGIFDYTGYRKTIRLATRFLDTMVDLLQIPDKDMAQRTLELRRVGLGVMGFATTLKKMGIEYESVHSLRIAARMANILTSEARDVSMLLAEEGGEGYLWDMTRRNITVTCIAPTGGIRRLVADDGFAIEPLFKTDKRPSPEFEVKMTATWQQYIENAISKTITLPNNTLPVQIYKLFRQSYDQGCKGITVYRDGSRSNQPIKVCDGDSCEFIQM